MRKVSAQINTKVANIRFQSTKNKIIRTGSTIVVKMSGTNVKIDATGERMFVTAKKTSETSAKTFVIVKKISETSVKIIGTKNMMAESGIK